MPEIGSLPFKRDSARKRQLVRLVSSGPTELSIELQPGGNRIGRQRSNNHIVLVSPQVSRFHAEIDVGEEAITLRDLGSANGTFVNGERTTTATLSAGDLIAFSDQFMMRLIIDLVPQEPESLTLGEISAEAPTLPPETAKEAASASTTRSTSAPIDRNAMPPSLEERLHRSELASYAPPSAPSQPLRIGERPVEIPADLPATQKLPRPIPTPEPVPALSMNPADLPTTPWPQRAKEPAARQPSLWPSAASSTDGDPPSLPPLRGDLMGGPRPSEQRRETERATGEEPSDDFAQEDTHSGPFPALDTGGGISVSPEDLRLQRERQQLKVLYQVSKRCMDAESLDELDSLLTAVLERAVDFTRGFITYQLPNGDWKLVLSPAGQRWERQHVRDTVQLALHTKQLVLIDDSFRDGRLGRDNSGARDARLLLPLRSGASTLGAIMLLGRPGAFDEDTADFISLFGDIAALALMSCAQRELARSLPL